jgi:SprT-like family
VSCGFASSGLRSGHIGQCWCSQSSADTRNQIFISPALCEPVDVLDTLVHELIHAVDNCAHKHGKEFKKMALGLGLKGPMRSAGAGPELKAKLQALLPQTGHYPHSS